MIEIAISLFFVSTLHVLAFAVVGSLFDVGIKEISFGSGTKLFSYKKISVRLLQFGGYVSFLDTRVDELLNIDSQKALNSKPIIVQLVIILSGVFAVLSFSLIVLGGDTLASFVNAFGQILNGALYPFTEAQQHIHVAKNLANEYSFIYIVAIVGTKLSALNLFPFSVFNGGQALIIIAKKIFRDPKWDEKAMLFLLWPGILLGILWCLALGYYFYNL